jgi:hypothetical protein
MPALQSAQGDDSAFSARRHHPAGHRQRHRLITEAINQGGAIWGRFDVRISGNSIVVCRSSPHLMNLRSRLTGIATGDQAIFVRRSSFEQRSAAFPIFR